MLAGEPPFRGPTARAGTARRRADPVPAVRRLRDAVPAGVERALMGALARVPADRFASAGAFAEALATPGAGRPRARSVAVLPFVNLSADPENEYFADGITEDVIAQLSKIRALEVISRTSVMPFKKRQEGLRAIAAKLGVATLLEGSVRRAGDRVRIVAQLIDADTDQHLWAETYDRQLTDVFAIQTDVALQIAAALQAELSPDERTRIHKEPTNDLQAYQLYLQGRHCLVKFTDPGIRRGIEYFEQAIARDPEYALAHAGVAMAFTELGGQGGGLVTSAQAYERAKEAAAKALALDGALGEARCMLAFLKFVCDFDWTGAEAEFKRALDLSPGSADTYDLYGRMLSALVRHDEAIAMVRRAQELDPLAHRTDVASTLVRAGRYDEAVQAATRAVEFDPDDPRGRAILGWAHLKTGTPDTGLAQLERAVSTAPGNTLFWAQLGQAYALVGRVAQAREVLRQLQDLARERYVSPYHLAYIYTGLGEQGRRDRSVGASLRAAVRRCVRHQRLVSVHDASPAPPLRGPAREDAPRFLASARHTCTYADIVTRDTACNAASDKFGVPRASHLRPQRPPQLSLPKLGAAMRVLIALVALVTAPFLASVSQEPPGNSPCWTVEHGTARDTHSQGQGHHLAKGHTKHECAPPVGGGGDGGGTGGGGATTCLVGNGFANIEIGRAHV